LSTEHLTRQVQQQSWQPLAKRTNILILAPVIDYLWAHCHWDLGSFQRYSLPAPGWSWKKNLH